MKVAVGLSGGVDSAVTAYLLKKAGNELVGITMKIWDSRFKDLKKRSACFGADEGQDIADAQSVCDKLGIPFHVIDLAAEYSGSILTYFKEEYLAGRTPNPCVRCNQMMKFNLLLQKARQEGIQFDKFATGHYARVIYDEPSQRYHLKKGLDPKKDQSYFLTLLTQDQLAEVIFPLGDYKKDEVKEIARQLELGVHVKKESQDFFSGDLDELIGKPSLQGNLINKTGKIMGIHKGISHYTIGQRKGLGIGYTEPLYVTSINKADNTVMVGPESELYKRDLLVKNVNWISMPSMPSELSAKVKIRYQHQEAPALLQPLDHQRIKVSFTQAQKAVSPGQYAVFYQEDTVIGGGIIDTILG